MSKKIIFLVIFGLAGYSKAQDKAEQALSKFGQNYPQEKIHLFFNKNSYTAGENLWFKSFVFDGYNSSSISTTLFVELYDSNKTLIDKKLIPLLNGEGSGSILLPEKLKEDIYYVRAYTAWMSNFSEDFQSVRPIAVYNALSPEKLVKDTVSPWTASVYPESGTFIEGINTKFAVRMQSKGMTPSDWSGYVIETDKPDTPLVTFKGFDQNTGLFNLTPKLGKKYQVVIQDKEGKKQNIDLPEAMHSGINLQVVSNSDAVNYTLKANNLSQGSSYYRVIGSINSQLVYKARINKISNETSYSIPADKLVNGILQLTVFDDKENVILQRLCFVQPKLLKIEKPSIQSLSLNHAPREKNSFDIAKDPDHTNYTVAVIDSETESSEEDQSLLSTLWLTGDITSRIIKPAQYFTKNNNADALDALLISEKWKRFDWTTIISDKFTPIKYKPESYISYKGKVNVQGKPAPNVDLNLIFDTSNNGTKLYQVKTDNDGMFTLNNLVFEGSMKFSYQLNSEQKTPAESSVFFQPNYTFIPYRNNLPVNGFKLVPRLKDETPPLEAVRAATTKNMQKIINERITDIEEVKLKGQKKNSTKKLNEELSSPLFKSADEQIFDFVNTNNQASTNILQWLQGRVAGLQIQFQGGSYTASLRGSKIGIYLDEMQVDADQVNSISVSDIAMVKVIKGYFAGGFGGGNGAIAIYTRRGGSSGSVTDPKKPTKLKQITLNGYDKEEPFNNLIYTDESLKTIPGDTRSVLYWNPYLEVQPKEPTSVEFFNNDDAKNYRVIIIGFDKNNETPLYYNEIVQ
ncbi:hypothetical protein M2347_003843 [Chryseobacterium sp. H1D6B]|uniref:TonB-dependent receptor plug domain-containing protein n=1 Tax=Chryseobacterium sp. H1D6B TaxID=2940588 RepID=UPI0015C7CBAC|nr:TonB-dependent receptor plug domain-containing protein [Chryseobacterium sp. H1D6B]MDH6254116.1 hypothetical protein [Chryseobacterium sp. H1D6B]